MVDIRNGFGMAAQKSTYKILLFSFASKEFEQCKQRSFAVIKRYEVKVVEHARIRQLAQLCVNESAAQNGDDFRIDCRNRLSNPESCVDAPRKRNRHQYDIRRVPCECLRRQLTQCIVD